MLVIDSLRERTLQHIIDIFKAPHNLQLPDQWDKSNIRRTILFIGGLELIDKLQLLRPGN